MSVPLPPGRSNSRTVAYAGVMNSRIETNPRKVAIFFIGKLPFLRVPEMSQFSAALALLVDAWEYRYRLLPC